MKPPSPPDTSIDFAWLPEEMDAIDWVSRQYPSLVSSAHTDHGTTAT